MVIYDADARTEAIQAPNPARSAVSESVGGLVRRDKLVRAPFANTYYINNVQSLTEDLQDEHGQHPIGPNVRFSAQTELPDSTAFLVAPDLIVTAGHSFWLNAATRADFSGLESLDDYYFVLGWTCNNVNGAWREPGHIDGNNVYRIDRIIRATPTGIQTAADNEENPDFLVMRLARRCLDRQPLRFAPNRPFPGSQCWTVGHPLGLPLKYGEGSIRRYPTTPVQAQSFYFEHTLSTYPGSSGSPIFNAQNEVVGIHVRGPSPGFRFQGGTINAIVLNSNGGYYANGMRTDALRWLFRTDARVMLFITMKPGSQYAQFTPCTLSVSHWSQSEITDHISNVDNPPIDGTVTIDMTARSAALGLRPLFFRGFVLRLTPPGTQPRPVRYVSYIRIAVANPADANERFEYWDCPDELVGREVSDYKPINFVLLRILKDPIWWRKTSLRSTSAWPYSVPSCFAPYTWP